MLEVGIVSSKRVPTAIALYPATLERLNEAAEEEQKSRPDVTADAVTHYLDALAEGKAPPPSPPRQFPDKGARYSTLVRMSPELARRAKEVGREYGVGRQAVIRAAVVWWLAARGVVVEE